MICEKLQEARGCEASYAKAADWERPKFHVTGPMGWINDPNGFSIYMRTIYFNGKVYTGELPLKEAFLVEDGLFKAVGSKEEVLEAAGCRKTGQEGAAEREASDDIICQVDLQGRFVCPGFNDSHMHLLSYGAVLNQAPMSEYTDSLEHLVTASKAFFKEHPVTGDGWLIGRGWNHDYFADADRMPNRWDLDRISTTQPVCAVRCCGHALAVNSKALELLGITAETPSPEGGRVGMGTGALGQQIPDGRFYDNAMSLVYSKIPVPDKETVKNYIRAACKGLNSYGITSVQTDDYCCYRSLPWSVINEAYRELEAAGELTVRVFEQANFESLKDLQEFAEAGNVTGVGSSYFKIGPLKMLGDGSLGARTAYLSHPYADDPSTQGIPVFTQEVFDEMIGFANAHNMSVAVHAIGDQCLDNVLSAIEKALSENPREDHRHGIVHCQITRPDQLQKIAELGLHVYAQSIFLDYDINIVEKRVGEELAATSYSWKTLMDAGVSVSNGSDCPVELPNVLKGMQCAVTRCTAEGKGPYLPQQAFTVKEALDSFTIRGAESSFEEKTKGRIAPGYLADFVALEKNPFEVPAEQIKNITVLGAWTGGTGLWA